MIHLCWRFVFTQLHIFWNKLELKLRDGNMKNKLNATRYKSAQDFTWCIVALNFDEPQPHQCVCGVAFHMWQSAPGGLTTSTAEWQIRFVISSQAIVRHHAGGVFHPTFWLLTVFCGYAVKADTMTASLHPRRYREKHSGVLNGVMEVFFSAGAKPTQPSLHPQSGGQLQDKLMQSSDVRRTA